MVIQSGGVGTKIKEIKMKEKQLTKKQIQLKQDVDNLFSLQETFDKIQYDLAHVCSKLNERLTHILCVISDCFGIKAPIVRNYIGNGYHDNDDCCGFDTEKQNFTISLMWDQNSFPMVTFPTWFFWENDKKIAAYCKKIEEERLVHTKIAEDEEISAEKMVDNIGQKLSKEELKALKIK